MTFAGGSFVIFATPYPNFCALRLELPSCCTSWQVACILKSWSEDWTDMPMPDIIVGSDVTYDPPAFPLLVALVCKLLGSRCVRPVCNEDTMECLCLACI